MFGNVTALEGLHVTGKYRTKHDAHMLQACGLGSSQGGGGDLGLIDDDHNHLAHRNLQTGGKACLLIRKHDHFTPAREIRRHVRALARNHPVASDHQSGRVSHAPTTFPAPKTSNLRN